MSNVRTDEVLYTGMTTASASRIKRVREDLAERRKAAQVELQPDGHVILRVIAEEKANIPLQIWDLTSLETKAEDVKIVSQALKMYDAYLASLEMTVKQLLKKPKVVDEDE